MSVLACTHGMVDLWLGNLKRTFSPLCSEIKLRLACIFIISLYADGFCPKFILPLEWCFSESQLHADILFWFATLHKPSLWSPASCMQSVKTKSCIPPETVRCFRRLPFQRSLSGGNFLASPVLHLWRLLNKIYPYLPSPHLSPCVCVCMCECVW